MSTHKMFSCRNMINAYLDTSIHKTCSGAEITIIILNITLSHSGAKVPS